ncbi:sigma 54-interacting transcriptional regulator [uncultured Tissierella sp.]|jgi:transcriptional regulator with PAS, ATPase and Fis domain|uniref:sigma 54-interacting transcriptional regulator n=1 Tax=Tissierella sp. TaxID=41274 RepID=UPI0028059893|nr:sigma 54-interacting transcriptional regulator [uncultured Tissierella sp.]MDU5083261.1 sigma 54-interacting transcriptional regulator [Bacillota bacterium]
MSNNGINLYNLANSLNIGILVVDEYCNINFFNSEALNILELFDENNLNRNLSNILSNFKIKSFLKSNKKHESQKLKYNGKDIIVIKKAISNNDTNEGAYIIFQKLDTYKEFIRQFDDEIEASSLLNTVMEATNDAIVYVNKDGYIEMLSNPYAEFLGVDREVAIGKHVREVIENTRMDIVIKTGIPEIAQVQEINGKNMIATRIPVFVNGNVVGAVGKVLFKDVDELNSLYMKINKIEKELNLYKDEFKKVNKANYALDSIISISKSMESLKELTKRAAKTNSNVLILGESGTGKELFAHAIHNNSRRIDAPFIRVNCGAIPYELLESELFGYEEGSFTGAKKGGKIGKFKAADGGTIFLDEIGDLPMNMQVKLLRVLQDKEIERIGCNYSEKIDIRVIAATNKDLEKMVSEDMFRLDLYYRLNVVSIKIPPLRERKEDITILSKYLVNKISKGENIKVDKISESTIEYLKNYDWPGNVRELENILERAINFLEEETIIKPEHLPTKITGMTRNKQMKSLKSILEEVEKQSIIDSLIIANGNKTLAANTLDISRTSLYEKISKYEIDM